MTVGFYAPLPPARSGVADYAAALLAELRRHGSVAVAPRECDVALYHLGNNALHAGIYERALERPGVVALHDAVLHHFLLGYLGEARYVEEFVYNYGEWHRPLARELWRGRAGSGADARYFQFPMLRRVVARARAIVVHNPEAARIAAAACNGSCQIVEIPHLFQPPAPPPAESQAQRYRQRLGVAPGAYLFGVFGYLRESKRLPVALETFARLHREQPGVALLVAGEFVSTDLERAVGPLLLAPGVIRRPRLSDREFWLAAASVDACINLRYPAAGETSGIAIRLMGLGKPTLVTDSPECAGFPQDACLRIAPGKAERDSLFDHMRLLTLWAEVGRAIGQRGAGHIHDRHRVDQAGKRYWDLLCDHCG
jgi:glycosyltransferase involved in cell wall biosynthesis